MATPYPGLAEPHHPGREMRLGRYLFFVPPMLLVDMRATIEEGLLDRLDGVRRGPSLGAAEFAQGLEAIVTVLHRALKRNYPTMTPQEVEGLLDVANCTQVVQYVLAANELADDPSWLSGTAPAPLTAATGANGALSTPPSGENSNAAAPAPSAGTSTPSTIN